ncbi:MAG: NAD(P)H-hydrate dehydratase [Candidatus Caenarcaniphilales bacterium]|nr:NAD(P)H-hydrate dehydratase [Candidatus Caenarcaniphilales bacterium]
MTSKILLSAEAVKTLDKKTCELFGWSIFDLMRQAGRALAFAASELLGDLTKLEGLVVCGKGNNGGDGLIIAQTLLNLGAKLTVWLFFGENELSLDSKLALKNLKAQLAGKADRSALVIIEGKELPNQADLERYDYLIDALYGVGLSRGIDLDTVSLIERLNQLDSALKIAIDLPTGLYSDTGESAGAIFEADFTLTCAAPKLGMYLSKGHEACGQIIPVEIGIPIELIETYANDSDCAELSSRRQACSDLPELESDTHKYKVGQVIMVIGSDRYPGAACLASVAAARAGAGIIRCFTSQRAADMILKNHPDIITFIHDPANPEQTLGQIASLLKSQSGSVLLAGSGLSSDENTAELTRRMILDFGQNLVLDAGALTSLGQSLSGLLCQSHDQYPERKILLTPHLGEFRLIAGVSAEPVMHADRLKLTRQLAERWSAYILLKGSPSTIASPDRSLLVADFQSIAFAKAGTGDVLAGLLSGLIAQGLYPREATNIAFQLGKIVLSIFEEKHSSASFMASDYLYLLSEALKKLSESYYEED